MAASTTGGPPCVPRRPRLRASQFSSAGAGPPRSPLRRSSVTALAALIVLTAVLGAAIVAFAADPADAAALWPAGGKWLWSNPRPQGSSLSGVVFTTATRGWAVGARGVALRSTNGGASWSRVKLPPVPDWPVDLTSVSSASAATVWFGDSRGYVYGTSDGGTTWTVASSGLTFVRGLDFGTTKKGWAVGPDGTIRATTDGGTTWETQDSTVLSGFSGVSAVSAADVWAVATDGLMVHTTDGGANWASAGPPGVANPQCVTFRDAQHGWVGGYPDKVARTTDGGATWTPVSTDHDFHTIRGLAFSDTLHGLAAVSYNDGWADDGLVLETTDGGVTWATKVQTDQSEFKGVAVRAASTGDAVAVGTAGKIWRGTAGVWSQVSGGSGLNLNDIDMADAATGWACGYSGSIWRTTSGGRAWTAAGPAGGGRWNAIWSADGDTALAAGGSIHFARTTDGGATWSTTAANTTNEPYGLAFAGALDGWLVTYGGDIVHTSDGGATWTPQASGTTANLWAVAAVDAMTAVAVGEDGAILRTSDGGEHWGARPTTAGSRLEDVTFSSASEGWAVGSSAGRIMHTTDAGLTWAVVTPPADMSDASGVDFATPQTGWISLTNGSLLATTDGGASWKLERLANGSPLAAVDAVSPAAVFAVGDDGAIVARDGARPATSAPSARDCAPRRKGDPDVQGHRRGAEQRFCDGDDQGAQRARQGGQDIEARQPAARHHAQGDVPLLPARRHLPLHRVCDRHRRQRAAHRGLEPAHRALTPAPPTVGVHIDDRQESRRDGPGTVRAVCRRPAPRPSTNGAPMKTITPDQVPVADNPHGVDVRHLHATPHVMTSMITLLPGEVVKPHKAPVDAFFYVLEGTPAVEIEGETFAAAPDTLIPSTAGHLHSIRNEGDDIVRFLVVKTPNPKA